MKWNIKSWLKTYKLHLIIWTAFISYETVVIGLFFGIFGPPLTYISHYIAILLLFYFHAAVLFPWALKEKKAAFWRLPFIISCEITVFIVISYFIDKSLILFHIMPGNGQLKLTYLFLLKTLYRAVYFLGFATGYYYLITYIKERRKTNELEKQHLIDIINNQKSEQELINAENAFLKAQINPHFLFNTLDFIYHNIDASSPIAADAVIILTEMMRYAVDADKMGEYVLLGNEIDQAENLIYLSQMRNNHSLGLTLKYTEEARQTYLIPLVLLTLMENVFKHGNLNVPGHEAMINIFIEDHAFQIITDNLVNYRPSKTGSRTGLNNIGKRLKYAYGNDVKFDYHTNNENYFKLHLSIPIHLLKSGTNQTEE